RYPEIGYPHRAEIGVDPFAVAGRYREFQLEITRHRVERGASRHWPLEDHVPIVRRGLRRNGTDLLISRRGDARLPGHNHFRLALGAPHIPDPGVDVGARMRRSHGHQRWHAESGALESARNLRIGCPVSRAQPHLGAWPLYTHLARGK